MKFNGSRNKQHINSSVCSFHQIIFHIGFLEFADMTNKIEDEGCSPPPRLVTRPKSEPTIVNMSVDIPEVVKTPKLKVRAGYVYMANYRFAILIAASLGSHQTENAIS